MIEDTIQQITLLGTDLILDWQQDEHGLTVQLPEQRIGEHAFVIKMTHK